MQEESKNKKPKWGKPKLIILTRGKPEERVLQVCKYGGAELSGPAYDINWCMEESVCVYECYEQLES